jgi:hypothetical protein
VFVVSALAVFTFRSHGCACVGAEKPRELTEKEKMAAALFGGVGATTSSVGRGRKATTATATASPANKTGSVAGFGGTSSPAPAAASASDDLDLLGLGSSAPAPAPASAGGVIDLFGAPAAVSAVPSAASLPASLALVVGSSPRSPPSNQVFSRDASVTLSGYKAFKVRATVCLYRWTLSMVVFVRSRYASGRCIGSCAVHHEHVVLRPSWRVSRRGSRTLRHGKVALV